MDELEGITKAKAFFNKKTKCSVDNFVFKLHYRLTVAFLLVCTALGLAFSLLGDPMQCMSNDDIPEDLLDTYCWAHTTFSVNNAWNKTVGDEIPYPGVETHVKGQKVTYHAYYQWVPFFLVFLTIFFYSPKFLWRIVEDHRVENVVQELWNPVLEISKRDSQLGSLLKYLVKNRENHREYYWIQLTAEICNLANVIGQAFFINKFLGGYFMTYGYDALSVSERDYSIRYDPMIRVFPRVTKCIFYRNGPSGEVQKHDALCVLPINVINEKIFILLWLWFIILTAFSMVAVLYRMLLLVSTWLRIKTIQLKSGMDKEEHLKQLVKTLSMGDFMFWNLLAENMDNFNFSELVSDYTSEVSDLFPQSSESKKNSNETPYNHDPGTSKEESFA